MFSLISYLRLAVAHGRFLGFGFVMTFAACAGQTVIIGAFGPSVRAEFDLSHTAWSAIYMAGTLASAAVMPWSGQQIDAMPLRRYAFFVCAGLALAAVVMAAAPSVLLLIVAIFLLRQMGQGLASHTGTTATARFFHTDRGKALALVTLGDSVGKALLPVVFVIMIAAMGWRATYGVVAGALALGVLPLVWWCLRPYADEDIRAPRADPSGRADGSGDGSWTRRQVLRDVRFHLMLPAVLAPAFILTAVFLHHLEIARVKGWTGAWMTGNYWIFSVGAVVASLAAGPLIDRITAVRVLPAFLLPMAAGLSIIWGFDDRYWALPYLLLIGLSSGIGHTAMTAMWAEVYGLRHLGAIRALAVALLVFGSALGPLPVGALMDRGVSVEAIFALMGLYCLAATALMLLALKGYRTPAPAR